MRHRSVRGINLLIFNEWFEKCEVSKNEKHYEKSVNDERCRRYFIYAVWLYNSQYNKTPNKDEETVPAMESLPHETCIGSVKFTAFLSESSLLCMGRSMPCASGSGVRSQWLGHGIPFPHVRYEMLEMLTLHTWPLYLTQFLLPPLSQW